MTNHPEILWSLGQHLLVTGALAAVVFATCRGLRLKPAACHVLWLVVLVRLLIPPVATWPWTIPVGDFLAGETSAEEVRESAPLVSESAGSATAHESAAAGEVISMSDTVDSPFSGLAVSEEAAGVPTAESKQPAVAAPPMPAGSPDSIRIAGAGWLAVLAGVWLSGSLVVVAVFVRRILRVRRALAAEVSPESWLERDVADWSRQLGVTAPECSVSARFSSPFLWCLGKLRLVWPQALSKAEQREQARPVVVHELAHLKRRDHWTAWLELTALVVWWWNPLVWLVRRQLRAASEMACDAWVVELLPEQRRDYAESLLEFSRHENSKQLAVAVGAVGGSRHAFTRRLEMIMSEDIPARFSKWTLTAAVLLGAISLPAFSTEQAPQDDNVPPGATAPPGTDPDDESGTAAPGSTVPGPASSGQAAPGRTAPGSGFSPAEYTSPGAATARSEYDKLIKQGRFAEAQIVRKKQQEKAAAASPFGPPGAAAPRPTRKGPTTPPAAPPAPGQDPFGGGGSPFGIDPIEPKPESPTLQEVLEKINKQYYGRVNRKELERAAIEAILKKLDGDATVLTPAQMKDFARQLENQLVGVGIAIHIDKKEKQPVVTRVILRSPAQQAGLRANDRIVSIDGLGTKEVALKKIVDKLRGRPQTDVALGIVRGEEELNIKVTRQKFSPARVEPWSATADGKENYWLDKTTGYVHIPSFTRQTASQFRSVVSRMKEDGAKGLVLDLRNCPGGLLSAATEISDLFIDEGVIVSSQGRDRSENTTFRAKAATPFADLPVVVLVNKYTASAAEIVAACLQDHHRAAIVGEQTYGRGIVQSLLTLSDGGALKLTTAAWMRPNGRTLHRHEGKADWGVRPDPGLKVELKDGENKKLVEGRRALLSGEDGSIEDDAQLQKALSVLKNS